MAFSTKTELNIQIYGNRNFSYRGFVNRNGDITIPEIGPINVVSLTLDQSRELISKKVSSKTIGSETYVSLGRLRTISIFILGEAFQPGAYKISSLSTLSNLLFVSGGVSEIGSVRNIEVKRKGKTVSTFDLYDLLLKGDVSKDISLEQGDTIFIPIIQKTARAYGSFRRPQLFEIKDKEFYKCISAGKDTAANIGDPRIKKGWVNKNDVIQITCGFFTLKNVSEIIQFPNLQLGTPMLWGKCLPFNTSCLQFSGQASKMLLNLNNIPDPLPTELTAQNALLENLKTIKAIEAIRQSHNSSTKNIFRKTR